MSGSVSRLQRRFPGRWLLPVQSLGLEGRVALLVAGGLLTSLAIFALLGLSALRESSDGVLKEREALAQAAAEHLDSALAQTALLTYWSAPGLAVALQNGDWDVARPQLQEARTRMASVANDLLLFDSSGKLRVAEPETSRPLYSDLSQRTTETLLSGKTEAVDWIKVGSNAAALVVVPVATGSGQTAGYLGTAVELTGQVRDRWFRQISLGSSSRVDIVDGDGVLLTDLDLTGASASDRHSAYMAGLAASGSPAVSTCHDCHGTGSNATRTRQVMVFAPLTVARGGVALRQSEDEVMQPPRRLQAQMAGFGAIALLLAFLIPWLGTRSVVKPIRILTSSARTIAEGKLDDPVAAQGEGEIAELAQTLEYMRRRLQRSIEEIKACNADLDNRVRERTAELDQSRDNLERLRTEQATLIDRLSSLNAMAMALNRSLDLNSILNTALHQALALTGMEAGAIYLVDEHTMELELAAYHGLSRQAALLAANLGLSASLCAEAAKAGETLIVEDTGRYTRGSKSVLRNEKMRCMVRVPFTSNLGLLGTMCLGSGDSHSFTKDEMDLLVSVSSQIAVAVQNARLYEELRSKERMRGELLKKVITAQEEERKRIARELHDQTSQALAALAVAVETTSAQAAEGIDVAGSLARMKTLAVETLEEVHRLIFDLRPTMLDDLGLISALHWYMDKRLGEAGIKARMEIAGEERRLAPQIETALYRVVQEATNNVVNHSGAQSFTTTFVMRPDSLTLTMSDDGWGFDMAELARSANEKRGLGLRGMKERVEMLGGTLVIYSELGEGTKITIEVPLSEGEGNVD